MDYLIAVHMLSTATLHRFLNYWKHQIFIYWDFAVNVKLSFDIKDI